MSKEEGEHGETVEQMKLINDKLLNTPVKVDGYVRQAMTDDGKKDKLGDEVHYLNNPKVSKKLFGDDGKKDGRERDGGGIFGFLGFGGRKRRRRKKSRKKKKSKKRKSRRKKRRKSKKRRSRRRSRRRRR